MMSIIFLGFSLTINPPIVTGVSLWALTLYLSLARLRNSTVDSLKRWLDFTGQPPSETDLEKTQLSRESQREFWASLLSIVPFLIGGGLCYYGIAVGLGQSWAISFGIMGIIVSGIYELARSSGAAD